MALIKSLVSGLLVGVLLLVTGCGGPAALQSAEAFSATDALYTAITSHRTDLLDESEIRLKRLKDAGKLSTDAFESLSKIIKQAQSGNWQDAAEVLDSFIRHQPPHVHTHGG